VYPKTNKAFGPDHNTGAGPSDYTETFVIGGHCGHKIILDSTPGNENIMIKHGPSGSYIQLDYAGNIQIHCAPGASIYDSTGDRNVLTTGDHNISVSKDLSVTSKNSKENVAGNKNSMVVGALSETVTENWDMKAKGIGISSNGDTLASASGKASFVAGDECLVKSSDKDVIVTALMKNVELKAKIGQLHGEALMINMEATVSATFGGLLTTVGGSKSMLTMVTGQIVMIG
jgi:hypothetical protein